MRIELIITLVIVLLVVILFVTTYYLKKKHYSNIDELDSRKKNLQEQIPVDKASMLEKMMITGQSKEMADAVLKGIEKIEVTSMPNIESLLFEAEQATDRYRFNQSGKYQQQSDDELDQLKETIEDLTRNMEELLQREQANLKKIDTIKKRYHKIRKELLAKSFSFGESIDNLEEKLGEMEKLFTSFSDLTASGDHEEAKKVVSQLENRLNEMEELMKQIPPLLETIDSVYTFELQELESGYKELTQQNYLFPEELVIPDEIEKLENKIQIMKEQIAQLEVDSAAKEQEGVEASIDSLYDSMELEIESKGEVNKLLGQLNKIVYYISNQDRELKLELDRISQSYILFKNEEAIASESAETLSEQKELLERIEEEVEEKNIPYSEAKDLLEKAFNQLEELSESYHSLSDILYSYRKQELEIKQDMEDIELDIKDMKRYVEGKHLPGLPNDYLDLFFYTSDRLEDLNRELARPKLNLEEVIALHKLCAEDCDHLAEQTEIVVDNAMLTELTSQRLYRFKEDNPGVLETIKYSESLFLDEYDYETSLKMVREKLESIEPGTFAEIKASYEKDKTYE